MNDYAHRPLTHSNEAEFMAAPLLIESKVQSMQTWGSKKIIYANLGFYFGFRFHALQWAALRERLLDSDCSNYLSTCSSSWPESR